MQIRSQISYILTLCFVCLLYFDAVPHNLSQSIITFTDFVMIFKPGTCWPGFLELFLSTNVCMRVCVCVSAPKLWITSGIITTGCLLLAATIITAYLITSNSLTPTEGKRSRWLAIRPVYKQRPSSLSSIANISMCSYILYLRCEDVILAILCTYIHTYIYGFIVMMQFMVYIYKQT